MYPKFCHYSASFLPHFQFQSILQQSKNAAPTLPPQIPVPIATAPKPVSVPAVNYITLSSFSWDQDNEKVKVKIFIKYVTCSNGNL